MAFEASSKEDYIELWRKINPSSYVESIESAGHGEGLDIPSLMAAQWSKIDQVTHDCYQAYYIKEHSSATGDISSGAVKSTGVLKAYRDPPLKGPITLLTGQIIIAYATDPDGQEATLSRYQITKDIILDSAGPIDIPIIAELPGASWNIEGVPDLNEYDWGKGEIDDPKAPFPGSPYGTGPSPWARFRTQDRANGREEGVILTSVSSVIGDVDTIFSLEDIGKSFVFDGLSTFEDGIQRRIVSVTGTNIISFTPALETTINDPSTMLFKTVEDLGVRIIQDYSPDGDITGGRAPTLDAIGSDRNVPRTAGEIDDDYRLRVCRIPDVVSPNAIQDIVDSILTPCGIRFTISETADIDSLIGFTWDLHPYDFGQITPIVKPTDSEYVGQGGVWLSEAHQLRFFLITVSCPETADLSGLAYDDGPLPNAYDEQHYNAATITEEGYLSCITQVYKEVDAARGAGVGFFIIQNCEL